MHVSATDCNGTTIIEVSGRMDALTAPLFEEACKEQLNAGKQKILVDLSGVEYTSSAGLRGILSIAKAGRTKAALAFCSLQPQVAEVFSISGFKSILAIHTNREEALKALG